MARCAAIVGGILGAALGLAPTAWAETQQAASCSQPDVQAALDAAADGDVVAVPAGECTWTTGVDFCKSVTLAGAGVDETIIVDDTPDANTVWNEVPFWISGCSDKTIRITGFTVRDLAALEYFGIITIWGDVTGLRFRFDHLRFDDVHTRAFWINGVASYGVIDHSTVVRRGDNTSQSFIIKDGDMEGSWTSPMSYGTANAVFLEDNVFDYESWGAVTDCENGGRYVFRNNRVRNGFVGNHGLDSVMRSCLQMEFYRNIFEGGADASNWTAMASRGGSSVMFDNTLDASYQQPLLVTNYRSCCYAGAACTPGSEPSFGDCDGTNPLDGNTEPQSTYQGWPCKDQIGRGTNQESYPVYEWNNTQDGQDVDIYVHNGWEGCSDPQPSTHVQEGRDYFNDTPMPGYEPYDYPHPLNDGGGGAGSGAGGSAAGAAGAGGRAAASEPADGGCGCRSEGGAAKTGWPALGLLAGLLWRRGGCRRLARLRAPSPSEPPTRTAGSGYDLGVACTMVRGRGPAACSMASIRSL